MENFFKYDWFKMSVTAVAIILAISFCYYLIDISHRQARIASNIQIDNQKCVEQAQKWLADNKYDSEYSMNHYNQPLNKCFVEYRYDTVNYMNYFLEEVFDNKEYARITWSGGKIIYCKIGGEVCHDSYKFYDFVKKYMEN